MSQSERLGRIHTALRENGFVRLEQLQKTFEVSRTTIMRDFELIRDRLGAPLIYDRGTKSYRLMAHREFNSNLGTQFEFPGMWLTPEEAYAVLTLYNVLRRIDPGVLHGVLSPLTRPVKRMLGAQNFPMRGFDKSIDIDLPGFSLAFKTKLTMLFSGLGTRNQLQLTWKDEDGASHSKRGTVDRLRLGTTGWTVIFTIDQTHGMTIPLTSIERCETLS